MTSFSLPIPRSAARTARAILACALAFPLVTACKPSSLVDVSNAPNSAIDPAAIKNAAAATAIYNSAIGFMTYALGHSNYTGGLIITGMMTDELQATGVDGGNSVDDSRLGAENGGKGAGLFRAIHNARVQQLQARQALQLYAPNAPKAWQGQLYANEGYTVLFFAEWFCSGIPLTSTPIVGPQTPTRGFTTEELYTRAIALFDSAIVAGADSARFVNLARVGKARALLGLGDFATADTVVQNVPTDFVYGVQFSSDYTFASALTSDVGRYRAQDNEGGSPMVWSADPRTGIVRDSEYAGSMLFPAKYYVTSAGTLDPTATHNDAFVRLADGLEARLIQAEAALQRGDANWLAILNTLRATCVATSPCAPVPGLTAAALPALADPGSADARLDLVMSERAMWLYLTGHREGDLRRLAHVYHRTPDHLWPTGVVAVPVFPPLYSNPPYGTAAFYGDDMVLVPPESEAQQNPLYGGCNDRDP